MKGMFNKVLVIALLSSAAFVAPVQAAPKISVEAVKNSVRNVLTQAGTSVVDAYYNATANHKNVRAFVNKVQENIVAPVTGRVHEYIIAPAVYHPYYAAATVAALVAAYKYNLVAKIKGLCVSSQPQEDKQ